jgi:hypothetical protein
MVHGFGEPYSFGNAPYVGNAGDLLGATNEGGKPDALDEKANWYYKAPIEIKFYL